MLTKDDVKYKSIILKTNYSDYRKILEDIERMDKEFRKTFKRAAKSQLAFSQSGSKKRSIYSLVLWYTTGEESEMEFYRKIAK